MQVLSLLERTPDVDAPELVAVDSADRLLLDTAAPLIAAAPESVAVVDDAYGALTLGALALHGASGVRVHQDSVVGEQALARNAGRTDLTDGWTSLPLGPDLVRGARVVLVRAPRGLDALREIAEVVAADADPSVTVLVGGRVKHMTHAMNDVLRDSFAEVSAGLGRQKSRVLTARGPKPGALSFPRCEQHADLGLAVCAHGAAFAGARIDVGTRALLVVLDEMAPDAATAVDLGCGTGLLAAALAHRRPGLRVTAADSSAAAVASAAATARANGLERPHRRRPRRRRGVPVAGIGRPRRLQPAVPLRRGRRAGAGGPAVPRRRPGAAPRRRAVDGLQHRAGPPDGVVADRRPDAVRVPDAEVHRGGLHAPLTSA